MRVNSDLAVYNECWLKYISPISAFQDIEKLWSVRSEVALRLRLTTYHFADEESSSFLAKRLNAGKIIEEVIKTFDVKCFESTL